MAHAFDSAKNTLHGWYKSTVEYVTPINEKSEFNEKGVLTPEEFLKAGCQLVYKCPTWSWEAGDSKKKRPFLPDNQQYLISRNLPCLKRVKSLMNPAATEEVVENGEWLNMEDTNTDDPNQVAQEIADIDLDAMDQKANDLDSAPPSQQAAAAPAEDKPLIQIQDNYIEEEEEDFVIPDMEDFDDTDNVVTTATVATAVDTIVTALNAQESETKEKEKEKEKKVFSIQEKMDSTILKTRTYDVSITYDKYYRVPRVWLRGYDENGNPLSSKQIFEDISADHAHKTVTVEPHIHTGVVCASIHPCRHSEVMKRFMTKFEESGKQITVDQYLFLFLKFMSAVIPTIQYDFTQSVDSK